MRETAGVASDPGESLIEPLTLRIRKLKLFCRERAAHAPAANAGKPVFARLLGEEIDDFERVPQGEPALAQYARDLEARGDARDSIETSSRWHRVAVRTDDEGA